MKYAVDLNIYTSNSTLSAELSMYVPDIKDSRTWPYEYILKIEKDIDGVGFLYISVKCNFEEDQIIVGNNIISLLNLNTNKVDNGSVVKYHYCHSDKITPGKCTEKVIWSKP